MSISAIFNEVLDERIRQDAKFGTQEHEPLEWLPILMEEVGEVAKEVCENHHTWFYGPQDLDNYRKELIQVAAVAVHMIENLDSQHKGEV